MAKKENRIYIIDVTNRDGVQTSRLGLAKLQKTMMTISSNLQAQSNGGEIKFQIDPAMLQQLKNAPGFVPLIINIQPLENLQEFLGLNVESKGSGSVGRRESGRISNNAVITLF